VWYFERFIERGDSAFFFLFDLRFVKEPVLLFGLRVDANTLVGCISARPFIP
jgi:hypothetical protein